MNEFTNALLSLWILNQRPSVREVARRTEGRISHTCVGTALNGKVLPRWNTCVALIEALGGDPKEFRVGWERADEANRKAMAS